MLWLNLAFAIDFTVPADGSLADALYNADVDQIWIDAGTDLSLEDPIVIDRTLTISGAEGVVLPPVGVIEAQATLQDLAIVGDTHGFSDSQSGLLPDCWASPCTLLVQGGQLELNQVVIDESTASYALHAVDADVVLTQTTISNHRGADDYSVLVEAYDRDIVVEVDDLTYTGNSGPFKVYDFATNHVTATFESSQFAENTGETSFAPDLYFWGVDDAVVSGTEFRNSINQGYDRGALHLHDSTGVLSNLTFYGDGNYGGGLSLISEYEPAQVEVYGIWCQDTVMWNGGCLLAVNLDYLYVHNLGAESSWAYQVGGAVAVFDDDDSGVAEFVQGDIRRNLAVSHGGGFFHDGGTLVLNTLRLCQTDSSVGAALYSEDGFVDMSTVAIQSPRTGSGIHLRNGVLQATNVTYIAGDDDLFNGVLADVVFDNSIFYGARAFQVESGTADMRYNLFTAGASLEVSHGEGLIEGDPGFTDDDLYDCDAQLIPATDGPAVDANPTEPEIDGTGIRDLGWFWGQESTALDTGDTDDPGVDDTGQVQAGFALGPATGGCGHAPLTPVALLGVVLAATRRRC